MRNNRSLRSLLRLAVGHPVEIHGDDHEELRLGDDVLSLVAEERRRADGILIGHTAV